MRFRHARFAHLLTLVTIAAANGFAASVWTVTSSSKPDPRIVHELQELARRERATLRFSRSPSSAPFSPLAPVVRAARAPPPPRRRRGRGWRARPIRSSRGRRQSRARPARLRRQTNEAASVGERAFLLEIVRARDLLETTGVARPLRHARDAAMVIGGASGASRRCAAPTGPWPRAGDHRTYASAASVPGCASKGCCGAARSAARRWRRPRCGTSGP